MDYLGLQSDCWLIQYFIGSIKLAGLTAVAGTHVRCPRIAQAPAALECRRYLTLEVGRSREIILGEVLGVFIRAGAVDPETKYVDQRKMDAIGRLGGHGYARTRDQFDLRTIPLAEWQQRGTSETAGTATALSGADNLTIDRR